MLDYLPKFFNYKLFVYFDFGIEKKVALKLALT